MEKSLPVPTYIPGTSEHQQEPGTNGQSASLPGNRHGAPGTIDTGWRHRQALAGTRYWQPSAVNGHLQASTGTGSSGRQQTPEGTTRHQQQQAAPGIIRHHRAVGCGDHRAYASGPRHFWATDKTSTTGQWTPETTTINPFLLTGAALYKVPQDLKCWKKAIANHFHVCHNFFRSPLQGKNIHFWTS